MSRTERDTPCSTRVPPSKVLSAHTFRISKLSDHDSTRRSPRERPAQVAGGFVVPPAPTVGSPSRQRTWRALEQPPVPLLPTAGPLTRCSRAVIPGS